jgi:LPS sulfotransferase NodH
VQFNVQREKESMVHYDKEGVDSIDFNYGEINVDPCAFCLNMYYICTRYKIVLKLDNVK